MLLRSGTVEVRDVGVLTDKKREINCGEKCGTTHNLREYNMQDVIMMTVCRHAHITHITVQNLLFFLLAHYLSPSVLDIELQGGPNK